jgi:FkbM family methyltransferase
MKVRTTNDIGRAIWQMGVYDLPCTEVIWRLLEPGQTAVDVGANIGYITGLMAARVGPQGRVLAIEPHPGNFSELTEHVSTWRDLQPSRVRCLAVALSSKRRAMFLEEPEGFISNQGIARLVSSKPPLGFEIETTSLDDVWTDTQSIDLLKLDVEGHELEVLRGCKGLLGRHRIRDIIFEEHSGSFEASTPRLLGQRGYSIFIISRDFRRPLLLAEGQPHNLIPYLPTNFLATLDPERALSNIRRVGWHALRARPSH